MSNGPRSTRRRFLAVAGTAALGGCLDSSGESPSGTGSPSNDGRLLGYDVETSRDLGEWDRYDQEWSPPTDSPLSASLTTERLVNHLEVPWDLSFAADGTLFVTERVGTVLAVDGDEVRTLVEPDDAIDAGSVAPGADESSWWVEGGEGGTLGVAAHPTYPEPPLVYVYYTYEEEGTRYNKVEYVDASADEPGSEAARGTLVDRIPANQYHNGGRLEFGPENYLWITTGDAGEPDLAADPSSLAGSVLRVTPAGDPVPDEAGSVGDADPRIYTTGHRNPQGVSWLPDGTAVAAEHGPSAKDELNRLVAGGSYGWPDVRTSDDYAGASGVRPPLANSGSTTWAPTGSLFYTGDAVPALQNRLLVGCLGSQQLLVATVAPSDADLPTGDGARVFDADWTDDEYDVAVHTTFEDELGRIRHVEQGPDGDLYAITSNRDGRARNGFPTDRDDGLVRITQSE